MGKNPGAKPWKPSMFPNQTRFSNGDFKFFFCGNSHRVMRNSHWSTKFIHRAFLQSLCVQDFSRNFPTNPPLAATHVSVIPKGNREDLGDVYCGKLVHLELEKTPFFSGK